MKKQLLTWLLCLLCLSGFAQSINPQKSEIRFKVSNMGVRTVEGTFSGISGTVNFNPQDLAASRINATIDVASINTGNEKRDDHLRSEDFFYVEQYPAATFSADAIEAREDGYVATGTLQVRGVQRKVSIPFTVTGAEGEQVLTGQLSVNRKDFNIGEKFGGFMVGRKVDLQIICVVN